MTATILAISAGAAIAVQNVVMVAMLGRGVGLVGALLLNSTVGIAILIAIELARGGLFFPAALFARFELWFLVPGVLGTGYVFASLLSYAKQGATMTIVSIVAAQLSTGLLLDAAGLVTSPRLPSSSQLAGLCFLLIGVMLVLKNPTIS